jgi:hypothetical protein
MSKTIDLSKTVYELCTEDPSIIEIMKELGFEQITKQGMLQSAGRMMTIPKGARMRKIDLSLIIETFENHGYSVKA